MRIIILLALGWSLVSTADAQQRRAQKDRVLNQISRLYEDVRHSRLTPEQLRQVQDHLFAAEEVVYGRNPSPRGDYVCVARDSDGRSPWSLAFRNEDRSVVKLPMVYNEVPQCESSRDNGRFLGENYFICSSRDGDGRSPWSVYSVSGTQATKSNLVFSSMETCQRGLLDGQKNQRFFFICSSRDNDGKSPWSLYRLKVGGNASQFQKVGGQTYSTYEECRGAQL